MRGCFSSPVREGLPGGLLPGINEVTFSPVAQSWPVVDIRVKGKVVPAGRCALASASAPPCHGRN